VNIEEDTLARHKPSVSPAASTEFGQAECMNSTSVGMRTEPLLIAAPAVFLPTAGAPKTVRSRGRMSEA